ncbi:Transglycosylase SLT domain-containing protein [Rhodovastum atsumiense]|uniref:Transglycosylase SLT domain-containing protein n=1 Tax=Rhodovastum atsumiense TaxID=504468 RepID=A0A5M6ITT1_9PROT|nr:transglycosylase SLT domain-containing protein [Rhodovastum atsumiense]KAA5611672.1 transglycosylase SLT domain-containing protein [Rhodovastum atsumiense]CAH2604245.1 Transglycosylase SLT domain-containing protein [Rhodovastum atsumiense]
MSSRSTPHSGLPLLRALACCATLALLSACAGNHQAGQQMSATQEAAQYQARARRSYTPPGPRSDPWGPYITEASARFDIPERWIREVMRVESSGKVMDTSPVGAMGLMQVMPATYDELRNRYDLGEDPYEPHDNIVAGTAYLREMYDIYGSPGFLAAYNAGPGRLDDYLTRNRPLPDETRRYVAKIGPYLAGFEPNRPSAAGQLAMNQLPINIPPGPRYPRNRSASAPVALAENRVTRQAPTRVVAATSLPAPPRQTPAPVAVQVASAAPAPARGGNNGLRLISQAHADTLPAQRVVANASGSWAIQVGAFGNEGQARAAADQARGQARDLLANARPAVGTVRQSSTTLYRARLTGLSRDAAVQACERIGRRGACIVLSPDAQS